MNRAAYLVPAIVLAVLLAGCSKDADEERAAALEEAAREMQQAATKMGEEMKNAASSIGDALDKEPENLQEVLDQVGKAFGDAFGGVKAVSASDLKAVLPEELSGMRRVSANAEKTSDFGIEVAKAEAVYESEDGTTRLTLSITDTGSMRGVSRFGMEWLGKEIDRESGDDYQRTTEYKGHKAFESSSQSGSRRDSEMMVFVGERFIVKAEGAEMVAVRAAIEEVDLDTLEDLREVGVASSEE